MMYSLRRLPVRGSRTLQMMPVSTKPKDSEGGSNKEKEDQQFTAYSLLAHKHNVNLSADDALEFLDYHTKGVTIQVRRWTQETYFYLVTLWFHVTEFNRPNQGIADGQYRVHLRNRTYDCGTFDALHYLCAHAVTVCQNLRLDPMSYIDKVYKIEYLYNVWRHVFPPVLDEHK
ncbi:hypothetical protein PVK06_030635 [Gossypium arboreum]|uniref:Zinc finger PMZ-type domain-containing protein n=1 Tax=Gossypium arboreum TaxID=29729 RepID=A0ABR0NNT2_GOSAR|nr:hypothetical protein PVK06_030635 [Gossypium arboreum]